MSGYHGLVPGTEGITLSVLLAARTSLGGRRTWALPIALLAVLVIVHVYVASGANLPLYWEDEAGYLGNAQVMSGVGHIPSLRGRPYYLGWSVLLVPLWWILQNGQAVYVGAVVLSALCGIATAIPLALIARRLGLSTPAAVSAGAVIALSPDHALLSGFGLPENLLGLLVAFAAYFGIRFHQEKSVGNAVGLALFVGYSFATHGRVIPIVIATGLWFLWNLRRHALAAVIGIVSMGLVAGLSFLLYRHVTDLLYVNAAGARESVGVGRILHTNFLATVMSGLGQVWYFVFATVGLTILGFVVLWRQLRSEWKRRIPGVALWTFVSLAGMAIISFTSIAAPIANASSRLDILSYGRYLDPIMVPVSLLGLVLVIKGLSRRIAIATVVSAIAIGVLWFVIVYRNRTVIGTQWWAPINITGTLQYGWSYHARYQSAPWSVATVVVVVALVAMLLLRKRPAILIGLLAVFLTVSTVYAQERVIKPFFAPWESSFTLRTAIADNPLLRGVPVSFDTNGMVAIGDIASKNAYQTLLAPTYVPLVDSSVDRPKTELVIARQTWPEADQLGARKIANDTGLFSNALWVLPGKLQDELSARNELIANNTTTAPTN